MSIGTLLRFLFLFDRRAILEIAGDRRALFTGFLFVLSAGLAREYDGEDLLHEPWYLLIPVGASLAASWALFALLYGMFPVSRLQQRLKHGAPTFRPAPGFLSGYFSFLGVFWMTAPLAGAYAVPYERFLSPAEAMHANIQTLAVVSAWRVLLMVRVATVLFDLHWFQAGIMVLGFGDAVLFLVLVFSPVPVIPLMGGMRPASPEMVLAHAQFDAMVLGFYAAVILLPAMLLTVAYSTPAWTQASNTAEARARSSARWFAWASVVIWLPILPWTQREQLLRHDVERAFRDGRKREMLEILSAQSSHHGPPGWQPPPRSPVFQDVVEMNELLLESPHAEWVHQAYREKLKKILADWPSRVDSDEDQERLANLVRRMPDGYSLLEEITRGRDDRKHYFEELLPEWKPATPEEPK